MGRTRNGAGLGGYQTSDSLVLPISLRALYGPMVPCPECSHVWIRQQYLEQHLHQHLLTTLTKDRAS